jgi:sugar O-acyltransferase (sialic acid O-acetyltransferase NeuD family)
MATAKPAPQGSDHGRPLTPRSLVVIGAGEHARVVIEAARSAGDWSTVGVVDPTPGVAIQARSGVHHLGDDADLVAQMATVAPDQRPWLILGFGGVGSTAARRRAVERYGPDAQWATLIHPTAWISPSATVGPGSVILAGAVVGVGARIGRQVIVNTKAVVEHDVAVGDQVQIAPGAIIGGGSTIGDGATIGLGALIRDHIAVGAGATVGMGAVVVADVAPDVTVVGSPARPRPEPAARQIESDAGRRRG